MCGSELCSSPCLVPRAWLEERKHALGLLGSWSFGKQLEGRRQRGTDRATALVPEVSLPSMRAGDLCSS